MATSLFIGQRGSFPAFYARACGEKLGEMPKMDKRKTPNRKHIACGLAE
jgi:hypothetical protein